MARPWASRWWACDRVQAPGLTTAARSALMMHHLRLAGKPGMLSLIVRTLNASVRRWTGELTTGSRLQAAVTALQLC